MSDTAETTNDDNGILYRAFTPLMALLFIVVIYGYYLAFLKLFGELGASPWAPLLAAPVALVVVPVLLLHFVTHTARSWASYLDRTQDKGNWTLGLWRPAALFLLCFLFSGYGVLSSAIRLIEGPAVIRASLTGVNDSFGALSGDADNILATPDWDTLQSAVESDKAQLANEIVNQNGDQNCGVKTHAQSIIEDIQQKLPNFRVPSGVDTWDHNCADTDEMNKISSIYSQAIDQALQNASTYASERVADKQALRTTISTEITQQQQVLTSNIGTLDAASTFIFHPQYLLEFENNLDAAAAVYASIHQQLNVIAPTANFAAPSPEELRAKYIDVIDNLVSPFQVVTAMPWLAKFFLTWVFLLAAIGLDLLTCLAASTVIRHHMALVLVHEKGSELEIKDARLGPVDYIWSPMPPSMCK